MMIPFGDVRDGHYALSVGAVHTLPLGRRIGVVAVNRQHVMVAFVGTDQDWTGGMTLRPGDVVARGGLRLELVGTGHDWLGQRTAEFEVTQTAYPGTAAEDSAAEDSAGDGPVPSPHDESEGPQDESEGQTDTPDVPGDEDAGEHPIGEVRPDVRAELGVPAEVAQQSSA